MCLLGSNDRKTQNGNRSHCRMNRHMYNIELAEDVTCKFCQDEEETPAHVIFYCDSLARTSFLLLGLEYFRANNYIKEPLSKVIGLIKRAKLESPFSINVIYFKMFLFFQTDYWEWPNLDAVTVSTNPCC